MRPAKTQISLRDAQTDLSLSWAPVDVIAS